MEYSIIIPYRDRQNQLEVLLPRLQEVFKDKEYEIIISEQNDNDNFKIACVENVGYAYAKGDTLIFHQVDWYPTDDVSYEVGEYPVLPHRKGIFLDEEMRNRRAWEDIPAGYRDFEEEVDPDFYGGIICMKRHHFEAINGFNPMYIGWGNEDEDVRERFKWAGIPVIRNEVGTFYVLHHKDNCPGPDEPDRYMDFVKGRQLLHEAHKYKHIGYKNLAADREMFEVKSHNNMYWVKSTNYHIRMDNESI